MGAGRARREGREESEGREGCEEREGCGRHEVRRRERAHEEEGGPLSAPATGEVFCWPRAKFFVATKYCFFYLPPRTAPVGNPWPSKPTACDRAVARGRPLPLLGRSISKVTAAFCQVFSAEAATSIPVSSASSVDMDAMGGSPFSRSIRFAPMFTAAFASRFRGLRHSLFVHSRSPLISWRFHHGWSSTRFSSTFSCRPHVPPHRQHVFDVLCSGTRTTTIPSTFATRFISPTPMQGGLPLFVTCPGRPATIPHAPQPPYGSQTVEFSDPECTFPESQEKTMSRRRIAFRKTLDGVWHLLAVPLPK